jgi:hypothetical protein
MGATRRFLSLVIVVLIVVIVLLLAYHTLYRPGGYGELQRDALPKTSPTKKESFPRPNPFGETRKDR